MGFSFSFSLFRVLVFSWNNGLREAVVNRDVFVFEHFFYSSAKPILITRVFAVNTFLLKLNKPVYNFRPFVQSNFSEMYVGRVGK